MSLCNVGGRAQLNQGQTAWVASACADCPGFLVLGAARAPASTFVSEPQILPWAICRNVLEDFCCIDFGGFCRGFSWRIFFWALFPTKMRRKYPARKSAKKSGGSKIKIREKSVLPKAGPNRLFPWACVLVHGPWTFAWICCPQLPYHPCKSGTHSTCFYGTRGHTPIKVEGTYLKN